MDITKLYKTQISLTEWLEKIGHKKTKEFRAEDNEKRERLKVLNEITGLPYDRPFQCMATDISEKTPLFQAFLTEHGHELCALRLIPLDPSLPKLRMRGHTIQDAVQWFREQAIDPAQYKADFVPHSDENLWSTIFVVNNYGIFGEIIRGGHHQLTQGFYSESRPITFSYDWKEWRLSDHIAEAASQLTTITNHLRILDKGIQSILQEKLQATFAHDYLKGYFESVTTTEFGLWFIDYSQLMGGLYSDFTVRDLQAESASEDTIVGNSGSKGIAQGRVRIVSPEEIHSTTLSDADILVCEMTTPDYVPLMQQAAAVITDLGGILSHAAIVCRELRKPCIVGTKIATQVLKNGDRVEVDAERGIVRI